ncbi:hypothetical protein L596_027894 [Steinernema carpocapsae]|uniref:Uncharacterized protein n=1 Tax=Steinernema carpocapsae TaxID=34508 RepID=A0A4U5LWU7_STECR|nr:hypothetical protein L596_027894 [Steinernema carpocapsae]
MTSCSQPAPSNPSSSATFSPHSDESSSSRRREQRIPDPSPTSASHSTSYHLRTIFANLRWSLLLAVLVFLLLASCECSARPQDDDLDSQAYSEYRVDPPTDLSRNQTAFFQLASRTSFNMLQGERVVEPPLDSQERRKEKWLERHKHRKNKNDRRGRKRLKGEQKESFILTRNELPKMKDNCVGVKITQRVRMAGCLTRVVHNRYSLVSIEFKATSSSHDFPRISRDGSISADRVGFRLVLPRHLHVSVYPAPACKEAEGDLRKLFGLPTVRLRPSSDPLGVSGSRSADDRASSDQSEELHLPEPVSALECVTLDRTAQA